MKTLKKNNVVLISIISGAGKTNITEVNSRVWLDHIALKTVNGDYHFILDTLEMTMPSVVGYKFLEDMALLLPFEDRKKLMGILSESI